MSLEVDRLRNSDTVVILNNTTGYVHAVYSMDEVRTFIAEIKPGTKLSEHFNSEELEILDNLRG